MNEYILSPQAMVKTIGSSKGSQPKYFDNGYWYKKNFKGYEGKSEYLVSKVLECSNLSEEKYVKYEECKINDSNGCRSIDFTDSNEIFLSFEKMHEQYTGKSLSDQLATLLSVKERAGYTLEFIEKSTGLNLSEYLGNILLVDALTLNPDRHTNNIGVIANIETGKFREAPIFDNGDSLMSNFSLFPMDADYETNVEKFISCPFSVNPLEQVRCFSPTLCLDYEKLDDILKKEPDCRAVEVLNRQIEKYRTIIPEIKNAKTVEDKIAWAKEESRRRNKERKTMETNGKTTIGTDER